MDHGRDAGQGPGPYLATGVPDFMPRPLLVWMKGVGAVGVAPTKQCVTVSNSEPPAFDLSILLVIPCECEE